MRGTSADATRGSGAGGDPAGGPLVAAVGRVGAAGAARRARRRGSRRSRAASALDARLQGAPVADELLADAGRHRRQLEEVERHAGRRRGRPRRRVATLRVGPVRELADDRQRLLDPVGRRAGQRHAEGERRDDVLDDRREPPRIRLARRATASRTRARTIGTKSSAKSSGVLVDAAAAALRVEDVEQRPEEVPGPAGVVRVDLPQDRGELGQQRVEQPHLAHQQERRQRVAAAQRLGELLGHARRRGLHDLPRCRRIAS